MTDLTKWEYELGEIVVLDPTGGDRGPKGKITGRTEHLDGAVSYTVSCADFSRNGITRHVVSEAEMHRVVGE